MADEASVGSAAGGVSYHALDADASVSALRSDRQRGLGPTEASARLSVYGPNLLPVKPGRTVLRIIVAQFSDFMILALIAAAVISALLGDVADALIILAIVIVNAAVGAIQEYRGEQALAAIRNLAPAIATVVRDGRHRAINAADIVPGDIVVLEAGAQVPADLRLLSAHQMRVSEAALTGESVAVEKHTTPLPDGNLVLADRLNMAFRGTMVLHGHGQGIAVATGLKTAIGAIASLIGDRMETETPLQRRLKRFGTVLAAAILGLCVLMFIAGLARGEPLLVMFLTAVTLAVAAIPEALPATVTISLALGARKMADQKAVVRRLSAVEGLGSITFICSDKTGTLTLNQMTVERVVTAAGQLDSSLSRADGEPWRSFLTAVTLNNDANIADNVATGDPTEIALLRAVSNARLDIAETRLRLPRTGDLVFDSIRKRMTTIHAGDGVQVAYTKGAPEAVIPLCTTVKSVDGSDAIDRAYWLRESERLAGDGLRVLAVAERRWTQSPPLERPDAVESDLVLLGLVAMIDPPRPETRDAVLACRAAGIKPVMITGDHAVTARAIAQRLGILDGGDLITGPALAKLNDREFAARVRDIRVYARVDPAQKIRVVEALQSAGEIVAMTGDGVNDAPALRQADIGVAMGKVGTDVAREVSDLVLLDDNFATIVSAVREGRRIYDNLRKVILYVMMGNCAELLVIFLAPFLGLPMPLQPAQILCINLLTDGLPALALTAEPEEPDTMRRPPRPPNQNPLADGVWQSILMIGVLIGGATLAVQAIAIGLGSHWQTMVFTVLSFSQAFLALALRSERQSLFQRGIRSNMAMLGAFGSVVVAQLLIVYLPPLQSVFQTASLSWIELSACLAVGVSVFVVVELGKYFQVSRRWARGA